MTENSDAMRQRSSLGEIWLQVAGVCIASKIRVYSWVWLRKFRGGNVGAMRARDPIPPSAVNSAKTYVRGTHSFTTSPSRSERNAKSHTNSSSDTLELVATAPRSRSKSTRQIHRDLTSKLVAATSPDLAVATSPNIVQHRRGPGRRHSPRV